MSPRWREKRFSLWHALLCVCLLTCPLASTALAPFPGLSWILPTTNIDGTLLIDLTATRLFRAPSCGGPWKPLSDILVPGTVFFDPVPLLSGNCYAVKALSSSGALSGFSNTVKWRPGQ
jgi:hypothetical protein